MVVQMPCPDTTRVFAASSSDNEEQARQEVQTWADGNGYRLSQPGRPFTIYHANQPGREWALLERIKSSSGTEH